MTYKEAFHRVSWRYGFSIRGINIIILPFHEKSLNSFIVNKDNSTKNPSDELTIKIMKKVKELSDNSDEEKAHIRVIIEKRKDNEIPNKIKHSYN